MSSILIVEDDAIIAKDLKATLVRLGYEVAGTSATGKGAMELLESQKPDLVLMDIQLKGSLDGIETALLMRETHRVPIVFLTAHSDDTTLARAKEVGPHGYLLKPFGERELRTTIEVALRKYDLERKLADRDRWFSMTLESVGDAVIATDRDQRITFMNALAQELTGWPIEEAEGKPLGEVFRLVSESGTPLVRPQAASAKSGFHAVLPSDVHLQGRDGVHRDVKDSRTAIVDDAGRQTGGVVVFRDVTEKRKLENRLARAERLASLGSMAAGIAHEINNPLAVVVANVSLALTQIRHANHQELAEDGLRKLIDDISGFLKDANDASDRVRRIVQDMRRLARADRADVDTLDLPDVLDAALKVAENHTRHAAVVVRRYGTTPLVVANEASLVQVFTNLLVNAAQAIGSGNAKSNQILIESFTDPDGRAVTEVSDTGSGISPEDTQRIFDPFFSTKTASSGMGLGLSICNGIVRAAGGEITVRSILGRGTTFRVSLPAASKETVRRVRSSAPPRPTRRGRVLVIDDERPVVKALEVMLAGRYEVVTETDANAALARCDHGENFDVIFCDLMMPNRSGMEFYGSLRSTRPDMSDKIVFMTGGAFSSAAQQFLGETTNVVLPKPFSTSEVLSLAAKYVG